MGQIVGGAAKPKRCNLNKLSQLGTPAAGEYILVSSDNSMNAAGQGNFDAYVVGDGRTPAIYLEIKSNLEELNLLNRDVFGNVSKNLVWQGGYIDANGLIRNSSVSQFSQPFTLKKGETITVGTNNSNITIIGTTTSSSVKVNDSVSVIQKTSTTQRFETYVYTAEEDIKIVLCVLKTDYTVDFSYSNNIVEKIEPIINAAHREINIDIPSLQIYRTNIYGGRWADINSTARKSIIVPTKKNFTYRLSVPAETTVYYCLVTDISNAMTNNSPVAFDVYYQDRVVVTSESTIDIAGKEGEYLWVREDTALNFSLTEIGNDYEYIWRSEIEDSLDSDSSTKVLSARQGKNLNDKFSAKVEHVIDYSSAGKNWATRFTEGTDYTLTIDPDNPRLITYTKLRNMPGSLFTLFISGLTDGEYYHWHMEYTSTSTVANGGVLSKQDARNSRNVISLNIEESRFHGLGSYTMDFDFIYDANYQFYGWWNEGNFSNGSTFTITSFAITQTKDIHSVYEMLVNGSSGQSSLDNTPILDESRHIFGSTNTTLNLLHFTDIHGDAVAASKIGEYRDKYSKYIDDVVDTGDSVYDQYTDGIQHLIDANLGGAFRTIGNHDAWYNSVNYDQSAIYNYIFAPFVSDWTLNGMTQPSNAASEYCMYWHKDYTDKKVRLIGLDSIYQPASQLSWFLNLLSETLDNASSVYGFAIVVASHVIPSDGLQNSFLKKSDGDINTFSQYNLAKIQNTPAIYLSDDYMNGVDTFIAQGGNFAVWLCGHTHRNVVFYTQEHPNILVLNAATAGNRVWVMDSVSSGTENQYLANVVSIDSTNKLIKIIRVGRKHDQYLRAANVLTIDYANKKVITNY